ncbi:hypothetical protein DL93DRAFT_2166816 [Clavulina sp. PMI_390]|nr:hypothetical protein DL93DRAFT_2166816 [Clavulina sp. PMI_390]
MPPLELLNLDDDNQPISSIPPSLRAYVTSASFSIPTGSNSFAGSPSASPFSNPQGIPTIPTLSSMHSLHDIPDEPDNTVETETVTETVQHEGGSTLDYTHSSEHWDETTTMTTPVLPTVNLTRDTTAPELCDSDASLWSRWASSSADADVFSTIALLEHTLPETEAILSRWDEAPFQPRPFSILAIPQVQELINPPRRKRSFHPYPVEIISTAPPPPSSRTYTKYPSFIPPPLNQPLIVVEDASSLSSEDTAYFDTQSELDDEPETEMVNPDTPEPGEHPPESREDGVPEPQEEAIPEDMTISSRSQPVSQLLSRYSGFEMITVTKRYPASRTPIPRLSPNDILVPPSDPSYRTSLSPAEGELWLRAQKLIHRPLIAGADFMASDTEEGASQPDLHSMPPPAPSKQRDSRLSFQRIRNSLRRAARRQTVDGSSTSTVTRATERRATTGVTSGNTIFSAIDSTEAIVGPDVFSATSVHSPVRTRSKLRKPRPQHEHQQLDPSVAAHVESDRLDGASLTSAPYKIADWLHNVFNTPPMSITGSGTDGASHHMPMLRGSASLTSLPH